MPLEHQRSDKSFWVFQSRAVLSSLPVTNFLLSGLKATEVTLAACSLCPTQAPEPFPFQIQTVRSWPAVTSFFHRG